MLQLRRFLYKHPQRAALEAAVVLDKRLKLARELRTPGAYVGYSAFVLFALSFGVRPYMWECENRIDIVGHYAPHLSERCQRSCYVDGVACRLGIAFDGAVSLLHVSLENPLNTCTQFIGGVRINCPCGVEGTDITSFYLSRGVIHRGTPMDGDCGIHTMRFNATLAKLCRLRQGDTSTTTRLRY